MTVAWSVGGQQETRTLTLDETNRRLLQKVVVPTEVNQIPADITIRASVPAGMNVTGMAVAEVTLDYNVLEPTTFTTYSVTPNVKVINDNNFMLGLSASRVDGKSGSMTVIEVGVPTSYQVNMNDPMFNVMGSSRVEVDDRKIILYYDELDATPVSATLPMKVTNGIPVNTQPTPVKIYDYYESGGEQQMTVNYELPKVGFICDRQPEYETCRYIKR
ncbi:murinoglobulin-2-like [Littorina saxatilis]